MPIRFHCKRCNQLLGIASRKAGSEIQCPKCRITQIVPSEEAALATTAMNRSARPQETVEANSDLVVYDDEPAAIETPWQRSVEQVTSPPVPRRMILYPRRTLYVQGLLFVILAVVAFGSGYFIGRGDANYQEQIRQEEAAKELVWVEGQLVYKPGTGRLVGDENAVIIALREGKLPEKKMKIDGIRPRDPPLENHSTIRTIREKLDGAYVRADASGVFAMAVPDQGKYWLLIISAHAERPKQDDIDEVDLAEMDKYFTLPDHLIGRYEYRWGLKEINIGFSPIEIDFSRRGQE